MLADQFVNFDPMFTPYYLAYYQPSLNFPKLAATTDTPEDLSLHRLSLPRIITVDVSHLFARVVDGE